MTTRKPKLRFLSALLAVAMLMTLLPTAAFAQDSVYPAITGPALGSANKLDENVYYLLDADGTPKTEGASSENYNVYYHDGTITLNNAAMKTPLYIPGGTTIEFLGTSSSGSADNKVSTAIQTMTDGNLTVAGMGSYTAYASSGDGIIIPNNTKGNIYVTGGTLNLANVETSLKAEDVEINAMADVTAYNISASKNLTIRGNARVTANKLDASEKINIAGDSTVNITGVGIYGSKGIDVVGNAAVEINSSSVSLNAFYGPININSTKKVIAKTTIANGAAIAAGVSQSENRTDVTINSEVEVEGFVGIAANGKESKVVIDGGKVNATSAFIGLYTQSNSTAGTVEIKNNAEVRVIGKGNQTPAIATYSKGPQPINIENSTVSVSNCGFGFSGSKINLTNSTVTADANIYAFLATPTLTYTNGAKIQAGASSTEAVEYNDITATADNYKEKYVKIEPGAPKYDIDLPDQSDVTVEVDGSTAGETQEGKKVTLKGTSDDAVYSYVYTDANNEKIETPLTDANKDNDGNYTFTMPKGGVTIRQYNNLHITDAGEAFTEGTYTETANDGSKTYYGNGWQFDGETLTITADQNLTKEANPVEVPVKVEKGAVKGGIFGNDVTVAEGADIDDAVVYGELTGGDANKTHLLTTDPKNCTVVPEGYNGGVSVQSVARTPVLQYTGKVYVVGDRTLTVAWPEGTTKMHWTATDGEGNAVELAKDSFDSETKILTVDMSKYSVLNLTLTADPKNDLKVDDFDFADGKLTLKETIKGAGEPSVVYRKVNGDTLGDEKLTSLKDAEAGLYQLEVSVTEGEDYNAATLTSESWRVYVSAKLTPGEKISYKITVKNGTTDVVEAQKGTLIKLFANDPAEGEEFDHWLVNGKKIDGDNFEMPAEDVTAVAVYKAKTYSVVFVTAHDTAPNSLTVKHGETISGDRILKADGYEFGGWYNGNEKFVFGENGTKVTSNLTLTAKWTEVKKPDPTPEEPDKPDTPNKPDQPSEPDTPNKPDPTPEPKPEPKPDPEPEKPVTYTIVVDNGTAYLDDGETAINKAEAGQTVTIKVNPEAITEGFIFDKWEVVSGEVKLADETASETTFEMPASDVELKATVKAVEIPAVPAAINPASVVAGTVVLGVGAVSVGWSAYNIATELYLKWVLPQGIIPTTRGQLALLLWNQADQPAAESTTVYTDIDDADEQAAARWVIENKKMELVDGDEEDVFEPDLPVDIFAVAKAWRKK